MRCLDSINGPMDMNLSKLWEIVFPEGSAVKNLLAMRVTWVQFLVWVDPLEKGTTTHSSILAWRDSPWGCKKSDTTE